MALTKYMSQLLIRSQMITHDVQTASLNLWLTGQLLNFWKNYLTGTQLCKD